MAHHPQSIPSPPFLSPPLRNDGHLLPGATLQPWSPLEECEVLGGGRRSGHSLKATLGLFYFVAGRQPGAKPLLFPDAPVVVTEVGLA